MFRIRRLLHNLFRRGRVEHELDEELRSYLDLLTDQKFAEGMNEREARREAALELGGIAQVKEAIWDVKMGSVLQQVWQDVGYGLRTMRRAPAFTAVAVLSLALGIGANTAIFSLVNTLMLRTLPVRDPGQLVELLHQYPGDPIGNVFPWQAYEHLRDNNRVLLDLIASSAPWHSVFRLGSDGIAEERVTGEYVGGNFFPALGVKPAIGRLIGPEDDESGNASSAVAVVSWSYWRNKFDLDPTIVGKQISVEDVLVTVIGVAPREFRGLQVGSRPVVWLPLAMEPVLSRRSYTYTRVYWLRLVGRLKPGVSLKEARAELAVLYRRTLENLAKVRDDRTILDSKLELEPAGAGLSPLRHEFGKPLLLLLAVAGLLLLMACTNVASILLSRGAARQREMALRVSLGASRFRLARQVLTESLLFSAAGALLGIVLAYFATGALVRVVESGRGRIEVAVEPDMHVLLFTAAASLLTGLLFGLAPAVRAMAAAPASSLRSAAAVGESKLGQLFGRGLIVTQVALSLVLLSAAGLFVSHLSNLRKLDLGFARNEVLLLSLDTSRSAMNGEQLARSFRELLVRLEAIPGVRAASLTAISPISGVGGSRLATVEGYQDQPGAWRFLAFNSVAPKYFETLGTPLVAGRDFRFDDPDGSRIGIINQTMARYYFGDGNAIGKHFTFDGDNKPYEIIGVVGDAEYSHWREDIPRVVYFNTFSEGRIPQHVALRTSVDPLSVASEARRTVRGILEDVPINRVTTLAGQFEETVVPERLTAQLSGMFGALGVILAAIGIYGLLAYTVARRINEIGIRMALGATPRAATRMVLRDTLTMVVTGVAIGVPIVFWGRQFAASVVEDLPITNPLPLVLGSVAMIAVAMLASYVPARRAARVDPMKALRHE